MPTFLRVLLARVRGFLRPRDLDRDFEEELRTHLAMAAEDKLRQGMTPSQARRAARLELGGLAQLREAGRAARGLPWVDSFWLDVKLGLRMLRKSWGLTLVGGIAMTMAIGIGVVVFAFLDTMLGNRLPLDEGDRVVAIQTWDALTHARRPIALPDFERWRDALLSVEDVGAFRTVERNLESPATLAEPTLIAEMTASGFRLARVPPLIGRALVEVDERAGADPVVVIGYDVWQSRFAADPAVLGQPVRLDDTVYTVVGVMPEGFAFPVSHRLWAPLKTAWSDQLPPGPEGAVFARLAPGITLEAAQAELMTLGLLGAARPEEQLQPRVVPYTFAFTGDYEPGQLAWVVRLILFLVTLLLIPPCANVAILVYARTVTRQEEFAARFALGAGRSRIVGQLFVELLVLGAVAAGVALVVARLVIWRLEGLIADELGARAPFWVDFGLSPTTVLFAAGLAVLAASITSVVPALKATGPLLQSGLGALGGRTGMQLGATWTALVMAQVAFSLAVLPTAAELAWGTLRSGILGPGFAAEELLTARLGMNRRPPSAETEPPSAAERFGALQVELVRQLEAEPGVMQVAVAAAVPGKEPWADIEVEGVPLPEDGIFEASNLVQFNRVDELFFKLFGVRLLTGRPFDSRDLEPAGASVIVDRTFAQALLGESNPLGRRLRYLRWRGESAAAQAERWYEIVGVVDDLPANKPRGKIYHLVRPGQIYPVTLALRVKPAPASLAGRLREVTAALDASLRVDEVIPLDAIYRQQQVGNNMGAFTLAAVTLSVLLLSAAGIYALMSFTVSERRREIGIRSALGARPHRVLAGICKRALGQLAVGAIAGVLAALLVGYYLPVELVGGARIPWIIPTAVAFMMVVGLLATLGPARRGLSVAPSEALREG